MLRNFFKKEWKVGISFIILGLILFIRDFNLLGSYNIYDPGDWHGGLYGGFKYLPPFLPSFLLIPLGLAILITGLKKKGNRI